MPFGTTVTGIRFKYSGSLAQGVTVFFKPPHEKKITPELVEVVRNEITKRSPVLMGANRRPLVANSVGETLRLKHNESPQVMSYVLPLLIEEGFCTVSDHKPFMIHRRIRNVHEPTRIAALPSGAEVRARLECSLEMLKAEDAYLLRHNVNERTLTHKLAEHLQRHFSGWHVDCEYNRNGVDLKKLLSLPDCAPSKDDEDGCTVFPDIIVHQRGRSDDSQPTRNLLVIEAKKSTNPRSTEKDYTKLRLYKQQLRYRHSAFVVFEIDINHPDCKLSFDPP